MKAIRIAGLIVCLLLALGTGGKLLKMCAIKGWLPGAVSETKVITGKLESSGRYGPAYWIAWDNHDPAQIGFRRLNLRQDRWDALSVGDEIEIRWVWNSPLPHLRTGIFVSPGNFVFDLVLLSAELTGVVLLARSLRRRRAGRPR